MSLKERIERELDMLREQERFRVLSETGKREGAFIGSEGKMLLNLSSNDYLGLGDDGQLRQDYLLAFKPGSDSDRFSMTSSSSRLLTGNHRLYTELEESLASWYGRQAGLVFNSGYHANVGILPALASRHDLILCDKLNHASIIDGCRIADAAFKRFRHLDYDHLEELLEGSQGTCRQMFIVTESVFSMDGDLADLQRLCELRARYGAFLIVDEAHGVGAFGDTGQGLCEASGLTDSIDMIIGTFGKAFASSGAYGIMDGMIRDYLVNTMRPLIFTTALPPMILGWSRQVLERQRTMSESRHHLHSLAARFRKALKEHGLQTAGESQIVPVIIGGNRDAVRAATVLRDSGFLALPVRPPTVPENTARIRFSLRADIRWEDIAGIPEILNRAVGTGEKSWF
ncbi:MAG: 8-amino-7-oxononanoate synthase [Prosthecochloris sp.]|nr:8-amino-7-oxononanoate synthase [Prosthecochloris sp.]